MKLLEPFNFRYTRPNVPTSMLYYPGRLYGLSAFEPIHDLRDAIFIEAWRNQLGIYPLLPS